MSGVWSHEIAMMWNQATRHVTWGPWEKRTDHDAPKSDMFLVVAVDGKVVARTARPEIAELIAQVPDLCEPILRKGRSEYDGVGAEAADAAHERGFGQGYEKGYREGEADQGDAMDHWREEYEDKRMVCLDDLLGLSEGMALILSKMAEEPIGAPDKVTKAAIRQLLDWRRRQMKAYCEKHQVLLMAPKHGEDEPKGAYVGLQKAGKTWGELAVEAARFYEGWLKSDKRRTDR